MAERSHHHHPRLWLRFGRSRWGQNYGEGHVTSRFILSGGLELKIVIKDGDFPERQEFQEDKQKMVAHGPSRETDHCRTSALAGPRRPFSGSDKYREEYIHRAEALQGACLSFVSVTGWQRLTAALLEACVHVCDCTSADTNMDWELKAPTITSQLALTSRSCSKQECWTTT